MESARNVMKLMGTTGNSKRRTRRPTVDEVKRLMQHFADRQERWRRSLPMTKIIPFAPFSARRQEGIVKIRWADLDEAGKRVLVRDMKDSDAKEGNHIWCDLPEQALEIILSMDWSSEEVFPSKKDTVAQAFCAACDELKIVDLRLHDLRHEGVSRLFEMGRTIPQAASVSGHRTWSSLRRYSHLRQTGDKWADFDWKKWDPV